MKRRMYFLIVLFVLLLSALVIRLATIQFLDGAKYRLLAEGQSNATLSGISSRGTIYDRNNCPLTDIDEHYFLMIEERKLDEDIEILLNRMKARYIENRNDKYRIYNVVDIDRQGIKSLCRNYGALAVKSQKRYSENQPAMHMIGYVNASDQQGMCGIEKDFDEVLSKGRKVFSAKSDGQGYVIPGAGIRIEDGSREWGVLTTLDLNLQKQVEEILSYSGQSGAIIITHIPSGEILASASSPGYDPYSIDEYAGEDDNSLQNKTIGSMYQLGPLFHVIVAAAALENESLTLDTSFNCSGLYEVGAVRLECLSGAHREIRLKEAFTIPCDIFWVQLAQLAGIESIVGMMELFGLREEPIDLLSGQAKGICPDLEDMIRAGKADPLFGQENVMVTPMQVARATRMIASGGWDSKLSIVRGTIEGIRGASLLPKPQGRQVLSEETAGIIANMIEEAVFKGDLEAFDGEGSHNWFTGYVPFENPLYGITIFIEDQTREENSEQLLASIFYEIANSLYP